MALVTFRISITKLCLKAHNAFLFFENKIYYDINALQKDLERSAYKISDKSEGKDSTEIHIDLSNLAFSL